MDGDAAMAVVRASGLLEELKEWTEGGVMKIIQKLVLN